MWQKLQQWMQDKNTERLGWAIFISLLLHALVGGERFITLPTFENETHTIEARLQTPKVSPPKEVPAQAAPKPMPEPAPEPAKEPPKEPPKKPKPEPKAPEPEPETPPTTPTEPPVEPTPEPAKEPPPTEPVVEDAASLPEELPSEINPNAYRYVETEFNVATKIDGSPEGTTTIVFDVSGDNHYKITSVMQARGLAGLFLGDLEQISEGMLTPKGLQPHNYLYQYGKKADKTYNATLDWEHMQLTHTTSKGGKTQALPEGTQDLLSFMYQFMYVPPLEMMHFAITNGKKLKSYDYQFEGTELIAGSFGESHALHIVRTGEDPDDKLELWLAPNYQHIPVKIRKTEKEGRIYEMIAKRVITNKPITEQR